MNISDKTKIDNITKINSFGALSLNEKLHALRTLIELSQKYAFRELHLESLLAYYYISFNNELLNDEEKCTLCLDIAEAYGSLGYAVLAMNICLSSLGLIKDIKTKDSLETRCYYLTTVFYNMIEEPLLAKKSINEAITSYETHKLNDPLLLANIYSETAKMNYSHPFQGKQKTFNLFLKAIELKEAFSPTSISLINDKMQYINIQDRFSPNMMDFIDQTFDSLSEVAYSKHYYAYSLYSTIARESKDDSEKLKNYTKAIEIRLLDYINNRDISALTWSCIKIAISLYNLDNYNDALELFLIAEKLYEYWEEKDTCDLKNLYEYIIAVYSKLKQSAKIKEYKDKYKKQQRISSTMVMASQFQYIKFPTLFEFLDCRTTTFMHKYGCSRKNIDSYVQFLLQKLNKHFEKIEAEEKCNRTLDESLGEFYFELGTAFYYSEFGIDSDYETAKALFEKGASRKSIQSIFALQALFSVESIAGNEIISLLKSAFERGDKGTGHTIAKLYPYGSMEREYYLTEAANANNAEAQYQLGLLKRDKAIPTEEETVTEKMVENMTDAISLWKRSSDNGYLPSKTELGLVYNSTKLHYDLGIEPYDFSICNSIKSDKNSAFKLFLESAKSGDARAQLMLGQFYMIDKELKDYAQAGFWLTLAAKQKVALAYLLMARIYADKRDLSFFNYNDAVFWYNKAYNEFCSVEHSENDMKIANQAKEECDHFEKHNFFHQRYRDLSWDEKADGV
jgi:TPR repeat protein